LGEKRWKIAVKEDKKQGGEFTYVIIERLSII